MAYLFVKSVPCFSLHVTLREGVTFEHGDGNFFFVIYNYYFSSNNIIIVLYTIALSFSSSVLSVGSEIGIFLLLARCWAPWARYNGTATVV